MATEEHKSLANFLKEVHSSLRKESIKVGADQAWQQHCNQKDVLKTYARCMEKLATTHWEKNSTNPNSTVTSRIQWDVDFCYDYFVNKTMTNYRKKETEIAKKMNLCIDFTKESFSLPIKLIDVGSCYNPFAIFEFMDVIAIDLCPANNLVLECDFLNVSIGSSIIKTNSELTQLQKCYFDVVTFCFLLEYMPSSELRIRACENAYRILKPEGLLIINTPDSKHVGANSKIMKCWQYTLSCMGFTRIKYEKFKHMHCMAFRKAVCKDTAVRWSTLHKEPYMEYAIHIPQDSLKDNGDIQYSYVDIDVSVDDFGELPMCDALE